MNQDSLDIFIAEVKKIWGPLNTKVVESCRSLLQNLAKAPATETWLAELLREPPVSKELYRDPGAGFVLLAHTENEGLYRVPHNHGAGWVIYAVQSGEMEMGIYQPSTNRGGKTELVRREQYRMRPGECRLFLPGDIHDTRCISKSVLMLRFTSCDLKKEDLDGRMIRYLDFGR